MPSSSEKQHRFMQAIANNPSFAKKVGVKQSVGKDFAAADKGKTFATGGSNKQKINKQNTRHGMMDLPVANLSRFAGMKKGGDVMKEPKDAMMPRRPRGMTPPVAPQSPMGMKKGGMANFEKSGKDVEKKGMKEGSKADIALDKKQMMGMNMGGMTRKFGKGGMPMKDGKPAFLKKMMGGGMSYAKGGMHTMPDGKMMKDSAMKKKMMGGGMAKYAKGGGIESRGKTKGTIIRMASGGSVSSASRRADGIAQRGKTRI